MLSPKPSPNSKPIRRRGRGYGVTWREKRPRPLTPEQDRALAAALDRLRRQAVSGEGPSNDT